MQYCLDVLNGKIWGKPSRSNHMRSQRYEGTEHFHNQIVLSHTVLSKYNEFPKNVLEMQNLCPRPAESVMGSAYQALQVTLMDTQVGEPLFYHHLDYSPAKAQLS